MSKKGAKVNVWYSKDPFEVLGIRNPMNKERPDDTHTMVVSLSVDHAELSADATNACDSIFAKMQACNDMSSTLKTTLRLKSNHVSMSVGDVVELSGSFYQCDPVGWTRL
jgi:hypothetical protein